METNNIIPKLWFNTVLMNSLINLTDELINELRSTKKFKFELKYNFIQLNRLQESYLTEMHNNCVSNNNLEFSWKLAEQGLDLLGELEMSIPTDFESKFKLLTYLYVWLAINLTTVEDVDRDKFRFAECKLMISHINKLIRLTHIHLDDQPRNMINTKVNHMIDNRLGVFSIITTTIPSELITL